MSEQSEFSEQSAHIGCTQPGTVDFAADRINHLRLAREAEANNDPGLGNLHRLVAQNCDAMASGDQDAIARLTIPQAPLTESIFDKNTRRLKEALAHRGAA